MCALGSSFSPSLIMPKVACKAAKWKYGVRIGYDLNFLLPSSVDSASWNHMLWQTQAPFGCGRQSQSVDVLCTVSEDLCEISKGIRVEAAVPTQSIVISSWQELSNKNPRKPVVATVKSGNEATNPLISQIPINMVYNYMDPSWNKL